MDKIRVCHICNLGMNGKAVFLCNLLEHTDFEKYDVTVINYRAERAESVLSRLRELPVRVVTPPRKGTLAFCRYLHGFFRENRFDVCHSHMWDQSGLFLAVAWRRGIPVRVAHSHTTSKLDGRYSRLKEFFRDQIVWRVLRRMIERFANRFVACSEEAARWLFSSAVIAQKKYDVVPNGIDLRRFACPDRQKHTSVRVLFAGRLQMQKNPVFALQVFSEFLRYAPDARMTLIGKGKLGEAVKSEIARLGLEERVSLVPETADMPAYYREADVYLFPSLYEGLGITLIEAQASGLKCLASDVVPRETQCGLTVYKALSDGAAAWAKTMFDLTRREDLAIDPHALERFDAAAMAAMMDRIYGL